MGWDGYTDIDNIYIVTNMTSQTVLLHTTAVRTEHLGNKNKGKKEGREEVG
jgi:hypothetical protein